MNRTLTKLKRYYYQAVDFFPTSLPVGLTAFKAWTDRLKFTYFPPGITPPDDASFQFSIASMILHLDPQASRKTNRFFGKAIYKGAANEVASYVMHDLKAKREVLIAAQEAEALRRNLANTQTEATVDHTVADGPAQ